MDIQQKKYQLHNQHKNSGVIFLTTLIFMLIITGLIISLLHQMTNRQKLDNVSYQIINQHQLKQSELLNTLSDIDHLLTNKKIIDSTSLVSMSPANGYSTIYFKSRLILVEIEPQQPVKEKSSLLFDCVIPESSKSIEDSALEIINVYKQVGVSKRGVFHSTFSILPKENINNVLGKIIIERDSIQLDETSTLTNIEKKYQYRIDINLNNNINIINNKHDIFINEFNGLSFTNVVLFAEQKIQPEAINITSNLILVLIKDSGFTTQANSRSVNATINETAQAINFPSDNNQLLFLNTGIDVTTINADEITVITVNNQQFIQLTMDNGSNQIINISYEDNRFSINKKTYLPSNSGKIILDINRENNTLASSVQLLLDKQIVITDSNKRCEFIAAK